MQRVELHPHARRDRPAEERAFLVADADRERGAGVDHDAGFLHLLERGRDVQHAVDAGLGRLFGFHHDRQVDFAADPLHAFAGPPGQRVLDALLGDRVDRRPAHFGIRRLVEMRPGPLGRGGDARGVVEAEPLGRHQLAPDESAQSDPRVTDADGEQVDVHGAILIQRQRPTTKGFAEAKPSGPYRGDKIRTCDLFDPNEALYQAELHPGHFEPNSLPARACRRKRHHLASGRPLTGCVVGPGWAMTAITWLTVSVPEARRTSRK